MSGITKSQDNMAESIKIQLSDKYQPVTEADIRTAKNFILRRESCANGVGYLIDGLLEDAAESITMLCYQFNVDWRTFQISSSHNERLYELIANILDQLEDDIMELMLSYSTKCTESDKKKALLLPWILALGIRRKNLQQITEKRIPGKGFEYMVYDPAGRLVATQDSSLRTQNHWILTRYDSLSRVTHTFRSSPVERTTMETVFTTSPYPGVYGNTNNVLITSATFGEAGNTFSGNLYSADIPSYLAFSPVSGVAETYQIGY